jgi:hypothetical protein
MPPWDYAVRLKNAVSDFAGTFYLSNYLSKLTRLPSKINLSNREAS